MRYSHMFDGFPDSPFFGAIFEAEISGSEDKNAGSAPLRTRSEGPPWFPMPLIGFLPLLMPF